MPYLLYSNKNLQFGAVKFDLGIGHSFALGQNDSIDTLNSIKSKIDLKKIKDKINLPGTKWSRNIICLKIKSNGSKHIKIKIIICSMEYNAIQNCSHFIL